jgi:hypothetical protein
LEISGPAEICAQLKFAGRSPILIASRRWVDSLPCRSPAESQAISVFSEGVREFLNFISEIEIQNFVVQLFFGGKYPAPGEYPNDLALWH